MKRFFLYLKNIAILLVEKQCYYGGCLKTISIGCGQAIECQACKIILSRTFHV